MADHLPDDPKQWPDDPFQLLGVEPPASEQDLKRAYTKLIRRFKPEHHPEQFRRVREAYEAALQHARWFGFFPRPEPAPEPAQETAPVQPSEPEPAPIQDHAPEPPRRLIDPAEEAWTLGVAGQRPEAYSRIIELATNRVETPDPALRLYWLLTLDPNLDPSRTRHDWLAAALTRSRLSGAAVELYRRELAANPEVALFGPYAWLLDVAGASASSVLWLARERLAAAGLGRWWASLDGDLNSLANRSAEFDEPAWLSYLVAVMGYAVFDRPAPLFERCVELLRGVRHLELSQSWAFDRLDELKVISKNWKHGTQVPGPVREVARNAWVGSATGWRKALGMASTWAASDPAYALQEFDRAARDGDSQPFLAALKGALDGLPRPTEPAYPPGLIRGLVSAFLMSVRKDYTAMRPDLIRFLVREAIDPEELVQACVVDSRYMTRSLVEHVHNDGVLWLVWRTATAPSPGTQVWAGS